MHLSPFILLKKQNDQETVLLDDNLNDPNDNQLFTNDNIGRILSNENSVSFSRGTFTILKNTKVNGTLVILD